MILGIYANKQFFMKKILISILLLAVFAIQPVKLFAADPVKATSSSKIDAELLSAYSVSNNSSLNFGKLIPTAIDGTVVINSAGTSCTETDVIKAAGHTFSAASFTINSAVDVNWTLDAISSQTLKLETDNSVTMSVVNFTPSATSGNTATLKNFTIGATLNVPANKTVGKYTGSFPVTVNFN
jgi:hypothetical protein